MVQPTSARCRPKLLKGQLYTFAWEMLPAQLAIHIRNLGPGVARFYLERRDLSTGVEVLDEHRTRWT